MQSNNRQLALRRIGDLVPRLVTPRVSTRPRGGNMFDTVMRRFPAIANETDLSYLSPGHRWEFKMQINDELANIFRQGFCGFSRSALFIGVEQTLHSILFKLIGFSRQRSLGSASFLRTLPWCLSVQNDRADLLV